MEDPKRSPAASPRPIPAAREGARARDNVRPSVSVAAEALLVAIAQERDRAAFAALFREFAPRVKAFLLARRASAETADEVAQEVMLTVWRRAHLYDPTRGAARTWIYAIARNCLVDRVRAAQRPEPELDDPARVSEVPSGEAALLAREREAALAGALGSLPSEQVEVLRGAYFRGRSLSELASEQNLPLGTVKTRMRLALERLRGLLRAEVKPT